MSGLCAGSRDAALVICGQAISLDLDQAAAAGLLAMCGLLDSDPLAAAGVEPSARSCTSCGQRPPRGERLQDEYNGLCAACSHRWVAAGRPDDGVPPPAYARPYRQHRAGGRKPCRPRAAARP